MPEGARFLIACFAATLCAALAPVFVMGAIDGKTGILPFALWITLAHAFLLGLPAFIYLRNKHQINFVTTAGAGFVIGAIPVGLFLWPLTFREGTHSASNGVPTVIDGIPTWAGWLEYLEACLTLGGLGLLGGSAFWIALKIVGYPNGRRSEAPSTPFTRHVGNGMAMLGLVAAGVIFALPTITMDRSCHNMFRDGRSSIAPKLNMSLDIGMEDWPKLTAIFEEFKETHQMSLRTSGYAVPKTVKILALSLCNDEGVNIEINEQRWASENYVSLTDRGTPISVFEVDEGSPWINLSRALLAQLEATWPGKIQFYGPDGEVIPQPRSIQDPATEG